MLLVFALVAYGWLGANLFAGEIVAPMDLLVVAPGWAESGLEWPLSRTQASDIVDGHLPKWIFLKQEILAGRLPLWNPIPGGGLPAFGVLSHGYITPRFLLFLLFDDGLGYTLGLLMQATLAAFGTYILCRTSLGILPSLFAGVTYMMCGFNSVWAMWPHVATSLWIPWILWALILLAERPTLRRAALLAVFVACLVLGGYPPVGAFGLYAAAIFTLWLLTTSVRPVSKGLRFAGYSAAGVLLGFGLSGFQLLPFAEFLSQLDLSYRGAGSSGAGIFSNLWQPIPRPGVRNAAYVGLIPFWLAPFAVGWLFVRGRRVSPLSPIFWMFLAVFAFILAFQWPEPISSMLARLPVISWNPVNRILVVAALAMAVLGAIGLEVLLRIVSGIGRSRAGRCTAVAIGLVLTTLQIVDLIPIGREQNPVVPAKIFYPKTATIDYVRDHLRPGESILATSDGFRASGILGAYGFPEWFAHTLHVKGQKEALAPIVRGAWVTPTAAAFHLGQVNFDPVWFDAFGVCCVLAPKGSLFSQSQRDKLSPRIPRHRIEQTLRITYPSVIREFRVATRKGQFRVTIRKSPMKREKRPLEFFLRDTRGRVLASGVSVGRWAEGPGWVRFPLDPPLKIPAGDYRFEISVSNEAKGDLIRAWTKRAGSRYEDGSLIIDGVTQSGDLTFWVIGTPILDPLQWRTSKPGSKIFVIERTQSPPGAYVVPAGCSREEPSRDCMDWDGVELLEYSTDHAVYQVQSTARGHFVRTMRRWPGWRVFVNGREQVAETHLGILPAVAVEPGISTVEWRYEPASWTAGIALSVISLVVFAAFVFVRRDPASVGGTGFPR